MADVVPSDAGQNGLPWPELSNGERIFEIGLLEAKLWPFSYFLYIFHIFKVLVHV